MFFPRTLSLALALSLSWLIGLQAQPLHEYYFNNDFTSIGGGPTLTENLACGATNGAFSVQNITTDLGPCAVDDAFCFNDGGGVTYANPSYITNQYSINVFFKFNTIGGWSRIIDFSNSTADAGIYLFNNCLNFYPNGNVGTCPYFVANLWYLFTFVRDGATGIISVYVNGTLFGTYNDSATNVYRCATNTTPINFFRDDNAVPCETQPGCVKYLSITSAVLTPAQVNTIWLNICSIILDSEGPALHAECAGDQGIQLTWEGGNEAAGDLFVAERSLDGVEWEEVGRRAGKGNPEETYTLTLPSVSENIQYFRVGVSGPNRNPIYSRAQKVEGCTPAGGFSVYPNPAAGTLSLTLREAGVLEVYNLHGAVLIQKTVEAGKADLDLANLASGSYWVRLGPHVERVEILK